jgi:protein O-mannosyl-transferase
MQNPILAIMTVAAMLLIGWYVYQPATSSVFLLDDRPNLSGLAEVSDTGSALQFVTSGSAGPVGRPLALATFLPQAAMWDVSAAPFIQVNILIHLVNGLLAWLFFLQLLRARKDNDLDGNLIAIGAMALWLFLPLLASSSLMIVQRMATLAATFILLGLNGYLYARAHTGSSSRIALSAMTASVVAGTLLAVLAKENGAVLPGLVLVIEATLLRSPTNVDPANWRRWRLVFLMLPTLAIVLLLASKLPYPEDLVLRRGMTGWERLLTQAQILWEYLFNALVARPSQFGPFHDSYPVTRSILNPTALAAVASWIVVIGGAIRWRRKYPLAAFAVLWFLTGHVLESTTLPLELYFEHRNYVPLLGPAFALSYTLLSITGRYRNVARLGMGGYLLLNTAILFSVTSLWGKPLEAAGYWRVSSPNSVRAVAHLAARQMTQIAGPVGLVTLQEFAAQHPEHAYLRLHELAIACRLSSERDYRALIAELREDLRSIKFDMSVRNMLDNLMLAVSETGCGVVDRDSVRTLAEAVTENPVYANNDQHMSSHHLLMAGIAIENGDSKEAMRALQRAKAAFPSNKVNTIIVSRLAAEGRYDEARSYIEEAADALPWNPLRRISAKLSLEQLRIDVDAREMQAIEGRPARPVTGPG